MTEQWLRKYNALLPHVKGIIAIEELYQQDVGLAVANVLMTEVEKTATSQQQRITTAQPQKQQLPYDPTITELFCQAVVYDNKGDR